MKKSAHRRTNKRLLLLKTHRYIGLGSFIILVWLSVSGLLLNHTEMLELDKKFSHNSLLLSLYNIPEPQFSKAVKLDQKWLVAVDNKLYLNKLNLSLSYYNLPFLGAVLKQDLLLIALQHDLLMFTLQGEYIDAIPINANIKKLGIDSNQQLVLNTDQGCLISDKILTSFSACPALSTIDWVQFSQIPKELKQQLSLIYQKSIISLERIILDAHSGRIVGILGVYFMDIIAILIIILAISGLIIWLLRKVKKYKIRMIPICIFKKNLN